MVDLNFVQYGKVFLIFVQLVHEMKNFENYFERRIVTTIVAQKLLRHGCEVFDF